MRPPPQRLRSSRLVATNAGTSSSTAAFRPNHSSTTTVERVPAVALRRRPIPLSPIMQKSPRPLCTELPPSGAHSKMYWEITATGDAVVPSSQPEFRRTESSHAQAKALFRLRPCANALGDASSGSATSPQSLKNTPVSPLGSRICKEVLWNLEFAAHDAP